MTVRSMSFGLSMNPSDLEPVSVIAYASLKISRKWAAMKLLINRMILFIAEEDAENAAALLWHWVMMQPEVVAAARRDCARSFVWVGINF